MQRVSFGAAKIKIVSGAWEMIDGFFYLPVMRALLMMFLVLFSSCHVVKKMHWPKRTTSVTGTGFYKQAAAMKWNERDSFVVTEILAGAIPSFLKKFTRIKTSITDSLTGKIIRAAYYVAPDYLSIGTHQDWARVAITPMAAQKIADHFQCFLPTRKMVDDIYYNAKIKLEPVPMFAFRDSTPTMWHHHLIIEGQRRGKKGLIAGIKKDVVISGKILQHEKTDRVAIYGWHLPGGKPIQPLYTGHVNWYVDYSHGIRLVYHKIKVNGRWMDYRDVLKNPALRRLLCDEENCDMYRYGY
jgi:hypothetical protein